MSSAPRSPCLSRPPWRTTSLLSSTSPTARRPEGIATIGSTAYVGSLVDGDIYALDLRTGEGEVVSQGPGTPAVGLEATHGRLWVAGGPTGSGRFVDPRTGETLHESP